MWSASRLHHLEGLVNSLTRHLPLSFFNGTGEGGGGEGEEESRKTSNLPSLDKFLRRLVQLPVCGNVLVVVTIGCDLFCVLLINKPSLFSHPPL